MKTHMRLEFSGSIRELVVFLTGLPSFDGKPNGDQKIEATLTISSADSRDLGPLACQAVDKLMVLAGATEPRASQGIEAMENAWRNGDGTYPSSQVAGPFKIAAIKALRATFSKPDSSQYLGLREAKEYVEWFYGC